MRHLLAIATTLVTLSSASAGPMPSDKAEAIKAMGAVINAPETGKLYAPLQAKEPYENVTVERNIKYGQHDRNLLDVFRVTTPGLVRFLSLFMAADMRGATSGAAQVRTMTISCCGRRTTACLVLT